MGLEHNPQLRKQGGSGRGARKQLNEQFGLATEEKADGRLFFTGQADGSFLVMERGIRLMGTMAHVNKV